MHFSILKTVYYNTSRVSMTQCTQCVQQVYEMLRDKVESLQTERERKKEDSFRRFTDVTANRTVPWLSPRNTDTGENSDKYF